MDAWPVACPRCGGLSYVPTRFWYGLLAVLPSSIGFAIATQAQSVAAQLIGAGLVLGSYYCYMRFVPLAPTTPRAVRFMRWWYVIAWSALALLVVGVVLYWNPHAP